MTDLQVIALAVLVWVGCQITAPLPVLGGVILGLTGWGLRSPWLVLLAGLLLGLSTGHAAEQGYRPIGHATFDGVVETVSLPDIDTFSEQIDVRLGTGERVRMNVSPSAGSVRTVRPGMKLKVSGSVRPIVANGWYRSRHIVGRLTARSVHVVDHGPVHWRMAAALQRTVASASTPLDDRAAALYQGLVTGDDRAQGAAQKAVFRRTGLSHILAVSGQNVAFVLILVHLGVGSLPTLLRPPAVAIVLGLFALITQIEPSVLRATFTAGIGYWAVTTGRRSSGIRLLAIAVSVLLLIDPFLASAVGFQLSVVASGGILVLGPAIASRVPGPTVFSVPVAVTLAAQLAVSPLLLATFGEVSLVSLPANLLAGWAAGAVMMWGMSLGLVAGAIGGSFARAVQQPVRALLWWIDSVAGFFAEVPLPPFTVRSALACCGILLVSATLPSRGRWLVVGALTAGLIATSADSATTHVVAGGIFYRGDSAHQSVLVLEASADDSVVEDIVAINPDTVDVVVVKGGHRGLSEVVRELGQVAEIGVVLAPNLHTVVGGTRVREPIVFLTRLGPMTVTPVDDTSLRVDLEN